MTNEQTVSEVERSKETPCYEVYGRDKVDCTVFPHSRMSDLQEHVYQLLDDLSEGESIRIEFRNYTPQMLEDLYDEPY